MEKKLDKVYIEITNICNLNCAFCPPGKREKAFIPVERFEHVLQQVKDVTNMILLHVKGEPLLHPCLQELLVLCKKYQFQVTITTNGTLLMEKCEILKQAEAVRQINISLHSYVQNDEKDGKYLEKVGKAVDELKEKYISYRLWNLEQLQANPENKEILEYLGSKYGIPNLWEQAKQASYIKLAENVFLNQDRQFTWPDNNGKPYGTYGTCYGLRKQLAVLVNGDVVPCCMDAEGELKLGNVFTEPLKEILKTQKARAMVNGFQRRELVEPFCRTCRIYSKISLEPLTNK